MIEYGKNQILLTHVDITISSVFFSHSRVGFPEMPDMNIKVVPTYGDRQYKYTLLQDFLSARIRNELKVRYRHFH